MKISVITVCKNEVENIEKTLLSVFSQTHKNYEVIIIDGVSTDGTLNVVEKYRPKIAHLVSEKDKGIYSAMNKGIKLATGDLFYFLNANDILASNDVFENVVSTLISNPDAKLLFGDFNFTKDGEFHHKVDFQKNYDSYWLFRHNSMCQQAVFYKRELFEQFGVYDEKFIIAGDTERNLNFLVKNRVQGLYLPIDIVNFSMGGISADLKNRKILSREGKKLYKKYYADGILGYFMQKLLKFIKYFFPKFFLKVSSGHNREKINVLKVQNGSFSHKKLQEV